MAFQLVAQPKKERAVRKKKKREQQRTRKLTRAQACALVWRREGGSQDLNAHCQRCGREVSRDVAPWRDQRAQFNENPPRSRGGDPCNPNQIELTCRKCHFGAPSGGHAPSAARMVKKR